MFFCGIGGLAIGLWTRFFGGQPESLENVMASVKSTGGYRLERPGASVVGFLLPLVFGGSIGPEAGLTGIIAAACTRIGTSLKAAGIRVKRIADVTVSAALSAVFASPFLGVVATAEDGMPALEPNDYEFRRKAKLVLYTASALGAIIGIALFTSVFGRESGIPHFEGVTPGANELWWALPCVLLGYLAALVFHAASLGFAKVDAQVGDHPVAKPVAVGLLLGVLAVPLPYVLFPEARFVDFFELTGKFLIGVHGEDRRGYRHTVAAGYIGNEIVFDDARPVVEEVGLHKSLCSLLRELFDHARAYEGGEAHARRAASSFAASRKVSGMRRVTETWSPFTRKLLISISSGLLLMSSL